MKVKEMPKTLTIKMDPTLDALFDNEKGDRFKIKRGTQLAQVWALVQDVGRISELKLKNHLLEFGMDWQDASDLIMNLIKLKWVKKEVNGDIVAIRDKK